MSATITRDEWLRALGDVGYCGDDDQDAITTHEFAVMLGLSRPGAEHRLAKLVAAGRAVKTRKRLRSDATGRMIQYVAYRLVEPKKKGAR